MAYCFLKRNIYLKSTKMQEKGGDVTLEAVEEWKKVANNMPWI
jgi:hypothetical protein